MVTSVELRRYLRDGSRRSLNVRGGHSRGDRVGTAATTREERVRPIDAGLNIPSPWDESMPAIDVNDLTAELRALATTGLPATVETAGRLLGLRSVMARSVHPHDPMSRLEALNRLLVRLLVEWDDEPDGEALRIVFGIAPGTGGTTHTARRSKATTHLGYDADHFRKRVEPKLIRSLAEAVYTDLLRYKRRIRRATTAEEPTGDTPSLREDDLTHEEELISRIWQHVYGLRAELIAVGRLDGEPHFHGQVEDHRQAANREVEQLRALVGEYTSTYGDGLIRHGEAEYQVEGLERLAGWTP
jgi:hypothetical protein